MNRARRVLLVLCAGLLLLPGCADGDQDINAAPGGDFPMTVQNCGHDVTIDAPPERILTIGAEAPTLVAAAGGADRMVARSGEYESPLGEYESALQDVPQLTTNADNPSVEAIISQEPDLVVTRGSEDAAALEAIGIDRLVISGRCRGSDNKVTAAGTFEEVYSDIELYGRIFGTQNTATAAVAGLRERVARVEKQFKDSPQRRAAAVIYSGDGEQLGSYGRLSVAHQQIEALGLANVFEESPERFFEPSIEEFIERAPEVIALLFENNVGTAESFKARLLAQPELADVSAIRSGDIISIPFALSASSPISVLGLEMLADQLDDLS
jgi:iron complex transport system substrate-binding protein